MTLNTMGLRVASLFTQPRWFLLVAVEEHMHLLLTNTVEGDCIFVYKEQDEYGSGDNRIFTVILDL